MKKFLNIFLLSSLCIVSLIMVFLFVPVRIIPQDEHISKHFDDYSNMYIDYCGKTFNRCNDLKVGIFFGNISYPIKNCYLEFKQDIPIKKLYQTAYQTMSDFALKTPEECFLLSDHIVVIDKYPGYGDVEFYYDNAFVCPNISNDIERIMVFNGNYYPNTYKNMWIDSQKTFFGFADYSKPILVYSEVNDIQKFIAEFESGQIYKEIKSHNIYIKLEFKDDNFPFYFVITEKDS